ncbi:MAG: enoyl-CoA hydratase/isomerase family protein [Betaproteobacteria bacterium]|nr:enoyl-CoA hydratase/isomerase family protein [Betaproteobacteria bacterium]
MAAHETSNSGNKAAGSDVAAPAAATLAVRIDDGVAVVTLARPEVHNAFDEVLIAELTATLKALDADAAVRVVVLAGQGRSFCAGADLGWMQRMAGYSHAENLADAGALAAMLATLDRMGKPTIARVHGAAYGGGVGLVACCDIAVAAEEATFALSEVKLGLIPATIGPYVVAAIGARQARRYFLTAERFTAAEALRIGLVHDVVPAAAVDRRVDALIAALRAAGPRAQAEAKALVRAVSSRPVDDTVIADTVARIAAVRASAEGREGVAAFLERRPAAWSSGNGE